MRTVLHVQLGKGCTTPCIPVPMSSLSLLYLTNPERRFYWAEMYAIDILMQTATTDLYFPQLLRNGFLVVCRLGATRGFSEPNVHYFCRVLFHSVRLLGA